MSSKFTRPSDSSQVKSARRSPTFSEHELVRSICNDSYFEFVKEFWHTVIPENPKWNWHVPFMCNEYQVICERIFKGMKKEYDHVTNVSPGTSKSTVASVFLPVWCMTRMPSFRFIGASYSYPLAMDLSTKSRNCIESDHFNLVYPDDELKLRDDQNTKGYFKNKAGGSRYSVGVNGSVLGMHAHLIMIDDPLDPNEAMSELDLNRSNNWIKETLSSRKVDKAVSVTGLVMQRIHQDDPTAQMIKKKNVRHLCLPADVDTTDPEEIAWVKPAEVLEYYTPAPDEERRLLMDAERLSVTVLEEAKEQGEQYYATQFKQRPVPKGGLMFNADKIRVSSAIPPKFDIICRYWDKAGTEEKSAAYTVGVLMGRCPDRKFWILDVQRFRKDSYEREKWIRRIAERDGHQVVVGLEQEPGSGGKQSAQDTVGRLAPYRCFIEKVDKTTGGKELRADSYSVQVNAGNVYMVPADWNKDFREEHRFFPLGKYKDQVDAAAGAFNKVSGKKRRVGGWKVSQT